MEGGRRIRRRLVTHGCIRVYVKHIQGRLHGPHKGLVRGIIRSCPYTGIRKYVTSARVPTEMGGKVFCYQQPDNAECAALAGTRYYATACWMDDHSVSLISALLDTLLRIARPKQCFFQIKYSRESLGNEW